MAETKDTLSWGNIIKIGGVFISWAIGSGSVTGQASLQHISAATESGDSQESQWRHFCICSC